MFDDRGIVPGVHIVHLENDRLAAGLEQATELGLAGQGFKRTEITLCGHWVIGTPKHGSDGFGEGGFVLGEFVLHVGFVANHQILQNPSDLSAL